MAVCDVSLIIDYCNKMCDPFGCNTTGEKRHRGSDATQRGDELASESVNNCRLSQSGLSSKSSGFSRIFLTLSNRSVESLEQRQLTSAMQLCEFCKQLYDCYNVTCRYFRPGCPRRHRVLMRPLSSLQRKRLLQVRLSNAN